MKNGYDQFFKDARKTKLGALAASAPRKSQQSPPKPAAAAGAEAKPKKIHPKLRQAAAEKANADRHMGFKVKKNRKFPLGLVLSILVCCVLTGAGFLHLEQVESFVRRVEIDFLGTAVAAEPEKKAPAAAAEKKADDKSEKSEKEEAAAKPVKTDFTPEEINHFVKLNERKNQLDAREEELNRVETELQAQREELETRIKDLEKTRAGISQVLEERLKADEKKVETLVQVYSSMKPFQAAKIFESMDEDLAIEILGRMKKKNAAEVMNLMKPEKAQNFSEKYAGYKRK